MYEAWSTAGCEITRDPTTKKVAFKLWSSRYLSKVGVYSDGPSSNEAPQVPLFGQKVTSVSRVQPPHVHQQLPSAPALVI